MAVSIILFNFVGMKHNLTLRSLHNVAGNVLPAGSAMWLYGSRARGDEREDSDWDLLLLINKDKIEREDFDRYSYPIIEYGWQHGADLSPQMYTKKEWEAMRITPYYQNVENDKKVIYES